MGAAELASRTAWITALALAAQVSLGLWRVRVMPASTASFRSILGPILAGHIVIGVALPMVTLIHAWSSMKLPNIRETSVAGLWVAIAGLLLLFMQAAVGASLLWRSEPQRLGFRRVHLAMAVIVVALAGAHVLLNR
jgi:hypothetical protein